MPGEVYRENVVPPISQSGRYAPPAVRRTHHSGQQNSDTVAVPPFTNVQFHHLTVADALSRALTTAHGSRPLRRARRTRRSAALKPRRLERSVTTKRCGMATDVLMQNCHRFPDTRRNRLVYQDMGDGLGADRQPETF